MNKKGQSEGAVILVIVALIVAFVICAMGFDYVPAGHIGVKERMGVIDPTPWGPGIQWTGVFTSSQEFSTRIQLAEYDASAFTSDLQVVETKIAVNFRIDPTKAAEIYKNIGVNYQDIIITPIVQEIVKANTAKYDLDALAQNREAVKNAITVALINKLENKGLIVTEVALTNFEPSDEVKAAIENKQVAAQNALAAKNNLEATKFNAEAMKLQKDVLEIKELDLEMARVEKWNGEMPKIVVTSGDSSGLLLNLGLE